jgi:uncharacterized lipoprotein YbaY/uncharacterized lipoprotein NlpE involved in copper resistance
MKTTIVLLALAATVGTAGCAARPSVAATASVTGAAAYRERIAMLPGAVFEATLEDISVADAPAAVISTVRQEDIGNPPYRFELAYDPARIVPSRRYAVRARITSEGRLLFTSDQVYPVITNGSPGTVDIVLKRVAGAAGRAGGGKPGDLLATLPASFAGVLPCADCEGIESHLDLFPDGAYFLHDAYLGKPGDRSYDDVGTWAPASDGITLALKGGREAPVFYSIEDADTLRKLDLAGQRIESRLNYDLKRAAAFSPIEPRLPMRGMFTYMADAAVFAECTTGRKLPVAMEGGYIDLERAYLAARGEPGAAVMALVEGRIAMRPPMEGAGFVQTLVVDRYLRLEPGTQCAPRYSTASLEGTYWKLVALGGQAVIVAEGTPEPHLVLGAQDRRMAGSDGCNRMMAGYTVESDRILLTQVASTMMACATGMETAQRFAAALGETSRWRVLGRQLELYDDKDALLARFDARPLP